MRSPELDNQPQDTTPYTRSSSEMDMLLGDVVSDESLVYIDKTTNPDIGDFVVIKVDSRDQRADLGRTLEAVVFNKDAGYTPEFIQENFEKYDDNSVFLLIIDRTQEGQSTLAGALRIVDCLRGESETVSMFNEFYGEEREIPPELSTTEENIDKGLWDILTIVMEPEYRNGINSAWLYHGLYKMAQEEGVERWIANITPHEARNLKEYIGAPFDEITGVEPVEDIAPDGKKSIYGFYTLEVPEVSPSISSHIEEIDALMLSDGSEEMVAMYGLLRNVAQIVLVGNLGGEDKTRSSL